MNIIKNIIPKPHFYPSDDRTCESYEGIFFFNNTIAMFFV